MSEFEILPYLQVHELSCSYFMDDKKTQDSRVRLSPESRGRIVCVSGPLRPRSPVGAVQMGQVGAASSEGLCTAEGH